MVKFLKLSAGQLLFVALLMFTACDPDDVTPSKGAYESGVFITCEGKFSGGTGTVSFYNRVKGGIKNNIFSLENNGAAVGNILQSITVHEGNGYLVVNNANKILIVDPYTFKYKDSIGGLVLPRYVLGADTKKAYVSEWGANGVTGSVKVMDLATKKITKTILTGSGAERMLKIGNRLYVCNGGGFGSDSTVAVIDTDNDVLLSKIQVGLNPSSIIADANGDIWVLSGGSFSRTTGSNLVKIKGNIVVSTFDVPKYASNLVANDTKNTLYYLASKSIWKKDIGTTTPSVFLTNAAFVTPYALGFDAKSTSLYMGDAKDYASDGALFVIDATAATVKDSVKVGIIPGGFSFN